MSEICNAIKKDDIKKKLKNMINITTINNKEQFVNFCSDNNKIILSNTCEGITHEVPPEKICTVKCPLGTKQIGDFHTHTGSLGILSKVDVLDAIEHNLETTCIGYINYNEKENVIKCYDYPFNIDKQTAYRHTKLRNERDEKYTKAMYMNDNYLDEKTDRFKEHITTEQKNDYTKTIKDYHLTEQNLINHREIVRKQVEHYQKESCKEII